MQKISIPTSKLWHIRYGTSVDWPTDLAVPSWALLEAKSSQCKRGCIAHNLSFIVCPLSGLTELQLKDVKLQFILPSISGMPLIRLMQITGSEKANTDWCAPESILGLPVRQKGNHWSKLSVFNTEWPGIMGNAKDWCQTMMQILSNVTEKGLCQIIHVANHGMCITGAWDNWWCIQRCSRERIWKGLFFSAFSLSGTCSHVIGLVKSLQGFKLHNFRSVPDQQSCTSIPQQWHVPRGNKIIPVPINHVVVARPTEERKRRPLTSQIDSQTK